MKNVDKDLVIHQVISLMDSYSFDTDRQNFRELVQKWLAKYDIHWIYLATIEALYLGRYKAVSIEQILHGWFRLGKPNTHFGGDFERLVSRKLPRHFKASNSTKPSIQYFTNKEAEAKSIDRKSSIKENICDLKSETIDETSNINSDRSTNSLQESDTSSQILPSESIPPLPEAKITAPPRQQSSPIKKDNPQNKQSSNTKIVTFQPTPDGSEFFKKLKALADKQPNEE